MAQTAVFSTDVTYTNTYTLTSAGKFLESFELGERVYQREYYGSPGTAGQGSKGFGFREQPLTLKVVYVDSSGDAVASAINSDITTLTSQVSATLVLAGITFYACFVDAGGFKATQPKSTGLPSGLFWASAVIQVSAKRLS